MNNSTR